MSAKKNNALPVKTTKQLPASKKREPQVTRVKRVTPEREVDDPRNEIYGVLWIALGLFLFVCVISPSEAHWIDKLGLVLQQLLFGLFGLAAYALPLAAVTLGICCIAERKNGLRPGKVAAAIIGILCVLCLLNMIFLKKVNSEKYGEFLVNTYQYGKTVHLGGGGFSALLVYPLKRLIGNIGASILFVAGVLISVLVLTRFSIKRTSQEVGNAVQQQVVERRERIPANVVRTDVELYNGRVGEDEPANVHAGDPQLLGPDDYSGTRKQKRRTKLRMPVGRVDLPTVREIVAESHSVSEEPPIEEAEIVYEPTPAPAPRRTKKPTVTEAVPEEIPEEDLGGIEADEIEEERLKQAQAPKEYVHPPVDLLSPPKGNAKKESPAEVREKAKKLEEILASFDVEAHVINIAQGPAVTRYELQPAAGVKLSRIVSLTDDISMGMASMGIRMEAPIPGKAAVGIELPNDRTNIVTLREIIESDKFRTAPSNVAFALGRDVSGNIIVGDIAKMPHLLVAGATGMGKSVCVHSMLLSILYKASPENVRLILIDPKKVEFSMYNGIPHLLIPVVTDPKKAAGALNWAVVEMERRYKLFSENGVNNMFRFNEKMKNVPEGEQLSQIVIFIDELSDLMTVASKEVENSIMRLAQMARAAGIYLVIATQRPSVDVVTGVIKANIPSRIALKTASQVDSRTIIDTAGAERLMGSGDMLYAPTGILKPLRVQGAYVQDEDRDAVIEFVKQQGGQAEYDTSVIEVLEAGAAASGPAKNDADTEGEQDELLSEAIDIVVESGQASISLLQRKLRVGYARAGHLIDTMEQMGVVGESEGSKPRKVLMTKEEWRIKAGAEDMSHTEEDDFE